ncbi:MAG: ferritin [Candidatus Altiarchaeota archaeon]
MISDKMQDAMNEQMNAELYSSYLYLSMSAYFEDRNLSGFAQWMRVQAQEELIHAMKFYTHVIDRGGRVELKAIDLPPKEWKSPLEVFEEAYKHELKVTGLINSLVDLAQGEKDYASNSMLQWFVDEQVEEEASADDIVQKLRMIKDAPAGIVMYDRGLGKRKPKLVPASD